MIAFPGMLVPAAEKAKMKAPPDPNNFDKEEFPHFHVFCELQLCRPMLQLYEHWENAKAIARIPVEKLKTMTLEEFRGAGVQC